MKSIINTPTPSLKQSLKFYTDLNFNCILEGDHHYAVSGDLIIRINQDRYSRPGMVYYLNGKSELLNRISKNNHVETRNQSSFISDPNGVIVELNLLEEFPDLLESKPSNEIPGNFAGISIEAFDFKKTIEFWSLLGYKIAMGNESGGWVSMNNDSGIDISIMKFYMCPHLFYNPSFTYFNSGKNLEVIKKIKETGISITEEISHFNKEGIVDNIIIRDPGGFGFFIFND